MFQFSLVRALAARFVQNRRRLQEEVDIWRLYHFLSYHEQFSRANDVSSKEVKLQLPNQKVSLKKQYRIVHTAITKQLVVKLKQLAEIKDKIHLGVDQNDITSDEGTKISQSQIVRDHFGYDLVPKDHPSTDNPIPGMKLCGHVLPGSVICFFPGTVYLPIYQREMPNYPNISLDNHYLMSRTDSSIIDAKEYTNQNLYSFEKGHLIRHPLEGIEPNVMPFSYDVDPSIPDDLVQLIPNRYYKQPPSGLLSFGHKHLKTLLLVSMRHIRDEELFLNFRLHPDSKLPDWYSAVDDKENERRWK